MKQTVIFWNIDFKRSYKDPIGFNCTDSFWPLTCKKIQIGAHASVQIKTIIPLSYKLISYKPHEKCHQPFGIARTV